MPSKKPGDISVYVYYVLEFNFNPNRSPFKGLIAHIDSKLNEEGFVSSVIDWISKYNQCSKSAITIVSFSVIPR